MRRLALIFAALLVPAAAAAMEATWPMDPMKPNLDDKPSLQRGLQLYANYCLGCHSLKFQRYERTADDLEIPHDVMLENVVFSGVQIGGLMTNAMPTDAAKAWFGAAPPDLTMVAKVRGADWVYNYLRTFYADPSRPLGVNNKVFPNVGMPHALIELQGVPVERMKQMPIMHEDGYEMRDPLVPGKALTEERLALDVLEGTGKLSPGEYDQAVYDIVNFLYYVAEPARMERERLGVFVLLFLVILYVFTALLGREYSKAFH
jgi:cytochrome c1